MGERRGGGATGWLRESDRGERGGGGKSRDECVQHVGTEVRMCVDWSVAMWIVVECVGGRGWEEEAVGTRV